MASGNSSQSDYSDHEQFEQRLQNLVMTYPDYAQVESLAKTRGDKDIWLLTIGTGDIENKPALAVAGGITGDHLLGSELA